MLGTAKHSAKKKGIEFTLTLEWILERIEGGTCAISGLPFVFGGNHGRHAGPRTPSIDRKDPMLGYTPDNCQVVVWIYNCAKADTEHNEVMALAEALCRTHAKR
jgi:hypothetical protein